MNIINPFEVNKKINALPITLLADVDKYIDFLIFKYSTINDPDIFEISVNTKKMLDNRLADYLQNPHDVQDFDALLDELEHSK